MSTTMHVHPTPKVIQRPARNNITPRNNSTTMLGLQDALTEICNSNPGDKFVYLHIAQKHGSSHTTLSRAHRGV
jgi:hypothetical protein